MVVLADNKIREVQKATANFTALIGQGAFGPVYKAQMSTGEIVAVKVLANDSKQGEKEFLNEVPISCLLFLHIGPAYFLISS
jgi:Protein tyrosine and serine/threonine kinase